MSSNLFYLVTLFLGFFLLPLVNGALYVVSPRDQSTCRGGEPCTVTWLDDGRAPLLPVIGVSTVGLYTGDHQLLQTITPVDVGTTLSLTFTPNPSVGPNSGAYYISFRSTEVNNGTEPYVAYSPWFRLEGMSGSFDTPIPSATQSIPLPSETSSSTPPPISTITIVKSTTTTATPEPSMSISTASSSTSSSSSSTSTLSPSTSSPSSSSTSTTSSRLVTSVVPSTSSTTTASPSTNTDTAPLGADNGARSQSTSLLVLALCLVAGFSLSS